MANLNYNRVMIAGKLCADPEARTTPTGTAVTTFRVAVNRRYVKDTSNNADGTQTQQQTADFFTVVAWRERAEFVAKYFRKGSSIFVEGRLQERQWTDQQGQKRYSTEIVADDILFVDSKNENPMYRDGAQPSAYPADGYNAPQQTAPSFQAPAPAPKLDDISSEDDLPF